MSKRRRIIIFASIIVVIGAISATVAILLSQRDNTATTNQPTGGTVTGLPPRSAAENKANEADKAAFSGDVAGGVKQLDEAIQNTSNSEDQYIYYSRKATLLFNNDDLAGAMIAAKQAYEIKKSSDSAAFVGQIAQKQGDKPMAIDYYNKAIGLINQDDPYAKDDKLYYQGIISQLQGGN
jgi:tetratricopeptide (TPR) repeat protein